MKVGHCSRENRVNNTTQITNSHPLSQFGFLGALLAWEACVDIARAGEVDSEQK